VVPSAGAKTAGGGFLLKKNRILCNNGAKTAGGGFLLKKNRNNLC
jgi:hypothetical protein